MNPRSDPPTEFDEAGLLAGLEGRKRLIGDRDIQPVLDFLRELTQYSSFRELVDRRRALDERTSASE